MDLRLQQLLDRWKIECDINVLFSMWDEPHRSYHTLDHLYDLIKQIDHDRIKYSQNEYEKLLITAIFHDCVYNTQSSDNEEQSAKIFMKYALKGQVATNTDILEIEQMILDTKTHKSTTKLSKAFIAYDMNIVERDFEQLLKWERGIYEEYKDLGKDIYKKKRLEFVESIVDEYPHNKENLLQLADWIKNSY